MLIPKIDRDACIGDEICVDLCPEVFAMGEDDIAYVKNPKGCEECDCEDAFDACPTDAITLEEK